MYDFILCIAALDVLIIVVLIVTELRSRRP